MSSALQLPCRKKTRANILGAPYDLSGSIQLQVPEPSQQLWAGRELHLPRGHPAPHAEAPLPSSGQRQQPQLPEFSGEGEELPPLLPHVPRLRASWGETMLLIPPRLFTLLSSS